MTSKSAMMLIEDGCNVPFFMFLSSIHIKTSSFSLRKTNLWV